MLSQIWLELRFISPKINRFFIDHEWKKLQNISVIGIYRTLLRLSFDNIKAFLQIGWASLNDWLSSIEELVKMDESLIGFGGDIWSTELEIEELAIATNY